MPTFTSVGSLGAAAGPKTGLYTLDFSFSRDVDAGAIVVLWVGWDSVFSIFTPRDDEAHVWDDVGNWWARLGDKTAHGCFAQCGAYAGIFIAQLKYPIPTGAQVHARVDYGGSPGLLENRMVSAWEFAVPDGYGWAATGQEATGFEEGPGTGVNLSWNDGENIEHLFLFANAVEGPDTDSFTTSTGFTAIDRIGNNGGLAEENVTLNGGWKIATASGTSSFPTLSPARDNSHVVVGVIPVLKSTTFPRTPIIDDFDRANESPMDGGIWETVSSTTGPSSPGVRYLQVTGNEAAAGGAGLGDGAGGQSTVEDYDCDDMEVYATYSEIPDNPGGVHLFIHHGGASDTSTASGWGLAFGRVDLPYLPAGWWGLRMGIQGNQGVPATTTIWFEIHEDYAPEPGDVWKLGMQRIRGYNHLWIDSGGGWEWVAARRAGGPFVSGKLGLAIWDPDSRVDDFGGGPTCFMVNMNWRSASRHKEATRALQNPSDDPV